MKKIAVGLLSAFLLVVSCGASSISSGVIKAAQKAVHQTHQKTILQGDKCSATAIAPSALLTATHCELGTDILRVDDITATIQATIRDGNDHTIYLLDISFENYASFGKGLELGDSIFIIGNPGPFSNLFRRGTVAGFQTVGTSWIEELLEGADILPPTVKVLYDFNGWPGDSGAAVFNDNGEIVGVVSVGEIVPFKGEDDWPDLKIMGGYSLAFTPQQLATAAAYRAPIKPKKPVNLGGFSRMLRPPAPPQL